MRRTLTLLVALGLAWLAWSEFAPQQSAFEPAGGSDQVIAAAFERQAGNLQVEGSGTVARVLPDDTRGSRHQRFTLRLASGQSLLVAHNIDLAPRIGGLKKGDTVAFFGEYEWNPKGGTIHWTHADPRGRHVAGADRKRQRHG